MKPFKVALIAHSDPHVPDWIAAHFEQAGIQYVGRMCSDAREIVALAGDADVVWTMGSNMAHGADGWREMIRQALPGLTRCGAIIRSGSGTDNIPVDDATVRNILVVNTPQATAEPVAEFTVALMLAVGRHLLKESLPLRDGKWPVPTHPTQHSLVGKTLGLVGFGQIAQLVARNVSGFQMNVIASDPMVGAEQMARYHVEKTSLNDLLARADYVSLHCPLTDATRGMIGEKQLACMKSSGILINTSRGAVIDEAALIAALEKKQLAGAGLDVLEEEPTDPANPLLHMDNVIVTPHIAAFSEQIFEQMWRLSVEAAIDLAQGHWPKSYVNDVAPRWRLNRRDG